MTYASKVPPRQGERSAGSRRASVDFDGDLYGRRVGIEFTRRLRGNLKSEDAASLIAQMKQDVAQAREILLRR